MESAASRSEARRTGQGDPENFRGCCAPDLVVDPVKGHADMSSIPVRKGDYTLDRDDDGNMIKKDAITGEELKPTSASSDPDSVMGRIDRGLKYAYEKYDVDADNELGELFKRFVESVSNPLNRRVKEGDVDLIMTF